MSWSRRVYRGGRAWRLRSPTPPPLSQAAKRSRRAIPQEELRHRFGVGRPKRPVTKAAGQKWRLDDAEGRCRYHQTRGQRSRGMGLSPLGGVRAGREKHCPFGEDAIGYIMYTESGAMAVQITRRRVPVVGKNHHLSLFWVL